MKAQSIQYKEYRSYSDIQVVILGFCSLNGDSTCESPEIGIAKEMIIQFYITSAFLRELVDEQSLERALQEVSSPEREGQISWICEYCYEITVPPKFILSKRAEIIMSEIGNRDEIAEELEYSIPVWLHKIKIKTMQDHQYCEIKANHNLPEKEQLESNLMPADETHGLRETLDTLPCKLVGVKPEYEGDMGQGESEEEAKQQVKEEQKKERPQFLSLTQYIPPQFSSQGALVMRIQKLFKGKESKHFPLLLLKHFRSYYQRKIDDGTIEKTLQELDDNPGFFNYLQKVVKELGDKISRPRKFLKKYQHDRAFLLLLYLPTTTWLKQDHPRIANEKKQYDYRKYFSQVAFILASKLEMI